MVEANNGVEMTRQQHEATHFQSVLVSNGSFIMRLEVFLAEMDRRRGEREGDAKPELVAMQAKTPVNSLTSRSAYGIAADA